MITAYKNIFSKEPHYITVEKAIERIKLGVSKDKIFELRKTQDKEKASELKKNLPSICFSGKFTERKDECIIEHSGYIVLDFDNVYEVESKKDKVFKHEFIFACWVSPSGNGIKALVKVADGKKHREHFQALQDIFPEIDKSGINESRVCYESYDENILIRDNVKVFTQLKTVEQIKGTEKVDSNETFNRILVWLNNTGIAFVKGERNLYIYKLASACCRFGINEYNAISLITSNISSGNTDFSKRELETAVKSAYKSNQFGTAEFSNDILVEKATRSEVKIDESIYDTSIRPKDVIFGIDCKEDAMNLFRYGYEKVLSTGCVEIDTHFKFKKGEMTLLSGIGNYGKSTFLKFLFLMQILNGKKIAIFTPEESPAHEFYNDFVEMYFGCNCIFGENRPTENQYEEVYDMITKNIFFIYPKDIAPTPDYIKERFLELIVKEGVEFCCIDPFNQMTNEYGKSGGRSDKYLETLLSDFSRFSKVNEVYFIIVAHPTKLQKMQGGNYPCPDVFDIADGAMWNNKMDNILVYHLPNRQTEPESTVCEFHAKKIRKRKVVGQLGVVTFEYFPKTRRFMIGGKDYVELLINPEYKVKKIELKPNLDFYSQPNLPAHKRDDDPFGTDTELNEPPF